jgi:hypothetical protein
MATDWRKATMAAILADGKIDEAEVAVLKKELKGEDGAITQEGIAFLLDLRVAAQKKAKAKKEEVTDVFEKFFFKVVKDNVLKDGKISESEATWLRANLFADKKIDDGEWAFLTDLNKKAKTKSAGFDKLYKDAEALRTKAAGGKK